MKYKTTAKLVIQACDKDLPGVFGHGCVLLLQGIAREHSLNRAAKSMGMAYSKAWRIVNEAEASWAASSSSATEPADPRSPPPASEP